MKWSQGWKQKLLDMRELRSKTPPGSLPMYSSTGHSDQQNDARQRAWQHMRAPWDPHSHWGWPCPHQSMEEQADMQRGSASTQAQGGTREAELTLGTSARGRGARAAPSRIRTWTEVRRIYTECLSTMLIPQTLRARKPTGFILLL